MRTYAILAKESERPSILDHRDNKETDLDPAIIILAFQNHLIREDCRQIAHQQDFEIWHISPKLLRASEIEGAVPIDTPSDFQEFLSASSSDTDMSDEEYYDALAEQFGESNEKE